MNNTLFINQLEIILNHFLQLQSISQLGDMSDIEDEEISVILTKAKAAVARIAGLKSEYYKDIEAVLILTHLYEGSKLRRVVGVVKALKSDLENDFLKTFHDIVQADVFSDYLEMAEYLEKEGYKDPAAVITGSTLEAHLKELCKSNSIDVKFLNTKDKIVTKKSDVLNADLAKAGIYSVGYQKQVTAWLGLRNSAAHGNYDEYTKEEVKLMLQGVRQFILSTK